MDILIKSFNRPYYLERCIRSIQRYVLGDYRIIVLDDGTLPEYLERIQQKFPTITLFRSNYYPEKTSAIKRHLAKEIPYAPTPLPVNFWRARIEQCTHIFLLLEEDSWFTNPVNLDDIRHHMQAHEIQILKLAWNGNPDQVYGNKLKLSDSIEEIVPALPLGSLLPTHFLFRNILKIRSILTQTGLLRAKYFLPYYTLYTVTSAFFSKPYWLYLWSNAPSKVNEMHQLYRAVKWYQNQKGRYGKTQSEVIKTSFITSATQNLPAIEFDMHRLNHYLNEAWFNTKLDVFQHFPNDFSLDYLKPIVSDAGASKSFIARWDNWITHFKAMHRDIGSEVD